MSFCQTCIRQAIAVDGQANVIKQEREKMHSWRDEEKADKRIAALRDAAAGWRLEAARCK
jgi:hypothetical protein